MASCGSMWSTGLATAKCAAAAVSSCPLLPRWVLPAQPTLRLPWLFISSCAGFASILF